MKKDYTARIIAAIFVICCFFSLYSNRETHSAIVAELITCKYKGADLRNLVSDRIKSNFEGREIFIDIYGITQRVLGKNLIGKYQFIRDREGTVHTYWTYPKDDHFADEVLRLEEYCTQIDTPFLYVQTPPRAIEEDVWVSGHTGNNEKEIVDDWKKVFVAEGIDYLDGRDIEGVGYFKTDGHMTTQSELSILGELVHYLDQEYGIDFYNEDVVMDWNNYTLDRREFLGNYAQSLGKYYTEIDLFDMYLPDFKTSLRRYDEHGEIIAEGDFQQALMNGYQLDSEADEHTYWITNFGNFTKPTYRFENLNVPNGADILLVMDSQGYRMASYMSLMCHSVTIVDPRYGMNGYYLRQVMEENSYDAVVLLQAVSLKDCFLLPFEGWNAEIVSYEVTPGDNGLSVRVTAKNTSTKTWSEANMTRMCIWYNGEPSTRIDLKNGVTVGPGEEYTFAMDGIVLPDNLKTIEFQMLQEGAAYFGEKELFSDLNAEIVSHTAPAAVNSFDSCSFSITVKNTGTESWSESKGIRLCILEDGIDHGYRISLPEGVEVAPGEEYTFEIRDLHMSKLGFTFYSIQMLQEGFLRFGGTEEIPIHANPQPLSEYEAEIVDYEFRDDVLEVTVRNTSSSSWRQSDLVHCCILVNGQDIGRRAYVDRGATVEPGESVVFSFENAIEFMTGNVEATMLQEGICYFGEREPLFAEMNAEIVTHTAPATVNGSDSCSFSITVKNTGTETWSESKWIRLCIWKDGIDHGYRIYLPDGVEVAPGEEYAFEVRDFRMPEPGFTTYSFQMLQEGSLYFGESEAVSIHANPRPLSDHEAEIVAYKLQSDTLEITVKNTSSSPWRQSDLVRCGILVNGKDIGRRAYVDRGATVEPGESVVFSFENATEFMTGNVEATMLQEGICYFGESEEITIQGNGK